MHRFRALFFVAVVIDIVVVCLLFLFLHRCCCCLFAVFSSAPFRTAREKRAVVKKVNCEK